MKRFAHILLWGTFWLVALALPAMAQLQFDTKAKYAILMDYKSGTVLFQKNADSPMEPASMAKLMTIEIVFDMLKKGSLKLDHEFFISEHAWREGGAASGGSTMFAKVNSKVPVEDLIRSVIVQSGNDASIALAEGIAGTEKTFAQIMNERALDLGMTDSHFTNATGLPDPGMHTTARDLAILARHIIKAYPEYYHYFSEPSFTWNKIKQNNRNTLLEIGIGVDGLKTGHTKEAGYGEVVSAVNDGRRLVAVVHGLTSMRERAEEARKLITWGARSFERVPAFKDGQVVAYANVYGGAEPTVGLVGEGPIDLYIPRGSKRCLSASVSYRAPLLPPVEKGQLVAHLDILCDGQLIQTAKLYAAESVAKGDLVRKATDALKELALGWL